MVAYFSENLIVARDQMHSQEREDSHRDFLGLLFDRISDCVVFADREGQIEFANRNAKALFGAGAGAAIGADRAAQWGLFRPGGHAPRKIAPGALPLARALK